MIHRKGACWHDSMQAKALQVGDWKFFGTFSPKLGEIINFPFILASQMWDALNLHLGSVPEIRNIGSHDLILRYCMLQRWFGGWAKKERFLDLPLAIQDASHHQDYYIFSTGSRDPHKLSFATATGWGVDASFVFLLIKCEDISGDRSNSKGNLFDCVCIARCWFQHNLFLCSLLNLGFHDFDSYFPNDLKKKRHLEKSSQKIVDCYEAVVEDHWMTIIIVGNFSCGMLWKPELVPWKKSSLSKYCWWKISFTTCDVWNLENNGINCLSIGAGFLLLTVPSDMSACNGAPQVFDRIEETSKVLSLGFFAW